MPENRIKELETQLALARETVGQLTQANAELRASRDNAELMLKRAKRNSRNDSSVLRDQITTLQNRRS